MINWICKLIVPGVASFPNYRVLRYILIFINICQLARYLYEDHNVDTFSTILLNLQREHAYSRKMVECVKMHDFPLYSHAVSKCLKKW